VKFHTASLIRSSLTCAANQYFGAAGWIQYDLSGNSEDMFVVDPLGLYSCFGNWFASGALGVFVSGNSGSSVLIADSGTAPLVDTNWHHFIFAARTDFSAHNKIVKIKIDGVDQIQNINDNSSAFTIQANGLPLYVGSDSSHFFSSSLCDLSIWAGIDLLTGGTDVSSATMHLFRSPTGAPVDPQIAIAALGHPPVMLSGGASSFASNSLGTSGAFTLSTGTLTDTAGPP
jgi:hypothetical protein